MEEWREISGFPGLYEVSNLGRIRSLDRISETANRWGRCRRFFPGRVLSITMCDGKYQQVTLCDGAGGRHQKHVHCLVAAAFIGPRPDGLLALHGDGNRKNCASSNLRYGTVADNSADAIAHGVQARGSRNGNARLTEGQVGSIRRAAGITNERLAMQYGVSESTIAGIKRGESWRHVPAQALTALEMR